MKTHYVNLRHKQLFELGHTLFVFCLSDNLALKVLTDKLKFRMLLNPIEYTVVRTNHMVFYY